MTLYPSILSLALMLALAGCATAPRETPEQRARALWHKSFNRHHIELRQEPIFIPAMFRVLSDPVAIEVAKDGYIKGYDWMISGAALRNVRIRPPRAIQEDPVLVMTWWHGYRIGVSNGSERVSQYLAERSRPINTNSTFTASP